MVIRPLRMRTSIEEFQEFNKMVDKSKKKKLKNYKIFSLNSGIGVVLLITTVFAFSCIILFSIKNNSIVKINKIHFVR